MGLRAGPAQLGVDQHQRGVTLLRDIDHNQSLVHVHLGGGQPDAFGLVHGLEHVGNQRLNAFVHGRHRFGDCVQFGVGVAKNG